MHLNRFNFAVFQEKIHILHASKKEITWKYQKEMKSVSFILFLQMMLVILKVILISQLMYFIS